MEQEFPAPRIDQRSAVETNVSGDRWRGQATIAAGLFAAALTVTVIALEVLSLDPRVAPAIDGGGKFAQVATVRKPTQAVSAQRSLTHKTGWDGGIANIVSWLDRTVTGAG